MKKFTQLIIVVFTYCLLLTPLLLPVKQAHAALDSKGTDFFVAFPRNYMGRGALSLYITSDQDTQGVVEIAGLNFVEPFSINAHEVVNVGLPRSAQYLYTNGITRLGVTVKADNEVTVYGLNQQRYTTDAYLALPVDVLGFEYIAMSYNAALSSQLAVVGVYDNTTVTITPSTDAFGHAAGEPFDITLNSSETFLLTSNKDLTGSKVVSTAPVSVISGVECAYVPKNVSACDHIVEMMPPVSTWGQSFITVPLATRKKGDVFRVLASQDDTSLTINGAEVAVINRGQLYETVLTDLSQIESSQPVLVAQYSAGQSFDGVISDPFMMLVPPSEQFLSEYNFVTLDQSAGFGNGFVNFVVPTDGVDSLVLDNMPVDSGLFSPVGDGSYSGAQIPVEPGSHSISSMMPFGIYVYGFGSYDSYGYPGGMSFETINPQSDPYSPTVQMMPLNDTINGIVTDSEDINHNGILDPGEDSNNDGLIGRRTEDANNNGILDEGEDLNGNGVLDHDTGIYRIEFEPNDENLTLQLDNFIPGSLRVNFTVSRIDETRPGFGVLSFIDGGGNKVSKNIELGDRQVFTNAWLISTLSTTNIDLDSSSFTVQPSKIEVLEDKTLIEWRFHAISIDQIENLDYDVVLKDPQPGENRLVTQQLDLYYTDINGNAVHTGLGSQFVQVSSSIFQLSVDTDKTTYTADETALIDTQIVNLSQYDQVVDVKIILLDSNGIVVNDYGLMQDVDLTSGQTWLHPQLIFNTGIILEGQYQIQVQLLDQQGSIIDFVVAPILITTPSDTKVSGVITTDKLAYAAFDQVNVQSRVKNITSNAILDGYTATTTIYNPDQSVLWTKTEGLPQLLPEGLKDLNDSIALNAAPAGSYRAELVIKDQQGIVRAISDSNFVVQSSLLTGSGVTGDISVAPQTVLKTENVDLFSRVSNTGNSELDNLPVTISIIDPANESVITEWHMQANLPINQTQSLQKQWQALAPAGATYIAVLSAEINGKTKYLDRAAFVIGEKIVNRLTVSDAGRVLILLDPILDTKNQNQNGAFETNDMLTRQRKYLENILQSNGWSYTIVTDQDSFTQELRSHAYNQYALFSARVKLDEHVQKELREAVFSGAGLLQAGNHDRRFNKLDDALGTVISGKHNAITGLKLIDSELQVSGQTNWYPDDKPLIAHFDSEAQGIGFYQGVNSVKQSALAVARKQYGDGHTVFIGYDLLEHASVQGADVLHTDLLLAALNDTTPPVKSTYTEGDPIPVLLRPTNKGTAASVQTTITVPGNVEILDTQGLEVMEGGTVIWTVDLQQNESAEVTLWLRAPAIDDSMVINTQMRVNSSGVWIDYDTAELTIALQARPDFEQIIDELQSLTPVTDYQPVLQTVNKARAAYDQTQYSQALKFLIQASDRLIQINTEPSEMLRKQLDLLITFVGTKV